MMDDGVPSIGLTMAILAHQILGLLPISPSRIVLHNPNHGTLCMGWKPNMFSNINPTLTQLWLVEHVGLWVYSYFPSHFLGSSSAVSSMLSPRQPSHQHSPALPRSQASEAMTPSQWLKPISGFLHSTWIMYSIRRKQLPFHEQPLDSIAPFIGLVFYHITTY